jgi:rhomboid protease GluP
VAVFGLETLAGGSTETEVLIRMGAKVTPLIAAGEYWRLFTSMFLHIGFAHLLFNGYALVVLGTELERILGWQRFLTIYVLAGLFGGLASYAFSPSLAAGASGAVFGLIGALAAFFLQNRKRLGAWGQRRLVHVGILIVINLFWGFSQQGIDNLAHLGGLVSGFALGWVLAPRYQLDQVNMRLVDGNRLRAYWPALILAVALLAVGTAVATWSWRNSPTGHLIKAEDAYRREAWDEVASELEQVAAADPSLADTSLYFNLGLAYSRMGRPAAAAEAYRAALELDPENSVARWNLALTYLNEGRYQDSAAQFEIYLELNPEDIAEVQPYLDELRRLDR